MELKTTDGSDSRIVLHKLPTKDEDKEKGKAKKSKTIEISVELASIHPYSKKRIMPLTTEGRLAVLYQDK